MVLSTPESTLDFRAQKFAQQHIQGICSPGKPVNTVGEFDMAEYKALAPYQNSRIPGRDPDEIKAGIDISQKAGICIPE